MKVKMGEMITHGEGSRLGSRATTGEAYHTPGKGAKIMELSWYAVENDFLVNFLKTLIS